MITVEVVYALPKEQTLLSFEVDDGITAKDAILQSGMLEQYPELDVENMDIGIFGKMKKMTENLRDKDRVEIYRPLIADPKEVRKRRAAEGKAMNKGGAKAGETKTENKKTGSKANNTKSSERS
ncbi:MAG TPA: RnfH family protein [Leucothrix mucor]|nr:RnfH family protein [Leucothrix mucor]